MKTLQCHSRGDTRFSPMFAYVTAFGVRDTIENHYQKTKVFHDALTGDLVQAKNWKQAKEFQTLSARYKRVTFELPNGMDLGNDNFKENDLVIQWYVLLWYKYLKANPHLVEIAKEYDNFVDIFKGKFPYCQADVIRDAAKYGIEYLKDKGAELIAEMEDFNEQTHFHPDDVSSRQSQD